jgi:transposase InsO family protein
MAWKEVSAMSARSEFVRLAEQGGTSIRELCREFEVSPTTAYKWIERGKDPGETFADRSRRPRCSPNRTADRVEKLILKVRDQHPVWNARKIRRVLQKRGEVVPAASTIGAILKRHGRITPEASAKSVPWIRFEHAQPNDLHQIDFKGHFSTGEGQCFPLTVIDDHSRCSLLLQACHNEQMIPTQQHVRDMFRRVGLPRAMNMDNGNPWGNPTGDSYTKFTVWLIRLGISVSHSRPYHPQTNGKDERFHRTLKAEVLRDLWFDSFAELQRAFDAWREIYNSERPHEGIGLQVPADRYRPSPRPFPEVLPAVEYDLGQVVRRVRPNGMINFRQRDFYLSQAFAGQPIAIRPASEDGVFTIHFCQKQIGAVDFTQAKVNFDPRYGI